MIGLWELVLISQTTSKDQGSASMKLSPTPEQDADIIKAVGYNEEETNYKSDASLFLNGKEEQDNFDVHGKGRSQRGDKFAGDRKLQKGDLVNEAESEESMDIDGSFGNDMGLRDESEVKIDETGDQVEWFDDGSIKSDMEEDFAGGQEELATNEDTTESGVKEAADTC
ncbi:hypothetical protein L873DRAFT_1842386 [Choiromyces venosus 120613-1]|uniref:Uncharacterized protein n=1 Tax=Choiromyces venosus 120613-1 TaxID=1336337 RepID=A0A3N4JWJ7_9PEZI|nr:hypothetical protein L873DRAFT_1842386 [Choiromyces venosus 120613-1]